MLADRQGNRMRGASARSSERYDAAIEAFNVYRGDPIALLDEAVADAPEHAMAAIAKAHLLALATEPAAAAMAQGLAEEIAAMPLDEREASHLDVLRKVLAGNWVAAAIAMELHNARWPRDLLGLQVGHLLDFFRGNARALRDRIARALPSWRGDLPGHGVVLGMYAFGLEETADYIRAEEVGRQALDHDARDCWAHHAVAHVMEMQGRAQDGIGWMIAREPHWAAEANFFKVHNWWHRALCHLDLGQAATVLSLYDEAIRGAHSGMALDLIDASALLWRLTLNGVDVGDRWAAVADGWGQHADGRLYPFNDWHAAMAYLGAGRTSEFEQLVLALRRTAQGESEVAGWARQVALPLIDGFMAFHRGDHARAIERLHPVRFVANMIGGSHAQRDIIDWTLTEAAIRAGQPDLALSFAHERLALKSHSPVNRDLLRRARALHPGAGTQAA
jgi:tetratricopeptide (TPR) repeat protein